MKTIQDKNCATPQYCKAQCDPSLYPMARLLVLILQYVSLTTCVNSYSAVIIDLMWIGYC